MQDTLLATIGINLKWKDQAEILHFIQEIHPVDEVEDVDKPK